MRKEKMQKEKIDIYIDQKDTGYVTFVSPYKKGFFGKKKLLPCIGTKSYKTLIEASAEARQMKEFFEQQGFETAIVNKGEGIAWTQ
jgi:hypothetical protein